MELLDENQCGFRCGRSTADVAQIVVRMDEDVCDFRKRGEIRGVNVAEEEEKPVARLLDWGKRIRVSVSQRYGCCWRDMV